MKEEIVIVNGRPDRVFENGDERANFSEHVEKSWKASPIAKNPQYVAIHARGHFGQVRKSETSNTAEGF